MSERYSPEEVWDLIVKVSAYTGRLAVYDLMYEDPRPRRRWRRTEPDTSGRMLKVNMTPREFLLYTTNGLHNTVIGGTARQNLTAWVQQLPYLYRHHPDWDAFLEWVQQDLLAHAGWDLAALYEYCAADLHETLRRDYSAVPTGR